LPLIREARRTERASGLFSNGRRPWSSREIFVQRHFSDG
jgi:hypothetical protein